MIWELATVELPDFGSVRVHFLCAGKSSQKKAKHSHLLTAKIKNVWSCTSAFPIHLDGMMLVIFKHSRTAVS
jgi:hypothetical protein